MFPINEPYHSQSFTIREEADKLWASVWSSILTQDTTWNIDNKLFMTDNGPIAAVVCSSRTARHSPVFELTLSGDRVVPYLGEDIVSSMIKVQVMQNSETEEKVIFVATTFYGENVSLIVDYFKRLSTTASA